MRRRVAAVVAALAVGVALAGCTQNSEIAKVDNGKNGVTVGAVQEFKDPTTPAIDFSGKTVQGGLFSSSDYRGKVLVVNFWYAGCGPCRGEASELESLSKQWAPKGVQFVGVNTEDSAVLASAFERTYGTTYPSILDVDGAKVQLAFRKERPLSAIPSTVILDPKGRIASVVVGPIGGSSGTSPTTVDTLIGAALQGTD